MKTTVEDAITKQCPIKKNDTVTIHNCIADACMSWRWCYKNECYKKTKVGPFYREIQTSTGYCGLCGKIDEE
jgi:hypothetical protein